MSAQRGATWCLWLSLAGIGLAGYLAFLHIGLLRGELVGGAVCGTSGAFDCHLVAGSPWSSFLGVPLALWGLVGYLGVFALSLLARQPGDWAAHAVTVIFLVAIACVAIDLLLFGLMAFVIRAFCLLCLATYAVNLGLLVVSARALGRPWPQALRESGRSLAELLPSRQRPAAWLFWGMILIGAIGVGGVHAATAFLSRGTFGSLQRQLREFVTKQPRIRLDVTADPAIGPPNAPLQIVEFSDFLCPACQRASRLNRIILSNHRSDAVFIFKHYPLDMSCNPHMDRMVHAGACQLAAVSECVHRQGKFWPFHDLIFEEGHGYDARHLEGDLQRLGVDVAKVQACLASGEGLEAVRRDIAEAGKVSVASTPTYVINGVAIPGGLSPSMFDEFVEAIRGGGK